MNSFQREISHRQGGQVNVIMHLETGVMHPQPKKYWQSAGTGKGKKKDCPWEL
jgi:hypothetical protein